jgi:hypothetical protein
MEEFIKLITGGQQWYWYAAAFFFALLGLFVRWSVLTRNGIKNNPESPAKFDFMYWWENNGKRKVVSVLTTFVVIFLCLRFATDWFGIVPSMAFSVGIGLAFDWFLDFVKKLTQKQGI